MITLVEIEEIVLPFSWSIITHLYIDMVANQVIQDNLINENNLWLICSDSNISRLMAEI